MVEVQRVEDGALLLKANLDWAAIETVLVEKGLRVTQLRHAGLDLSHQ